jgi:UPF0716 protein FxsA
MRIRVFPLLLALFVGLPLIDASLLVLLGRHVGFWQTVVLVIISGFAGAHLARSQGLQVWTGIRRDLSEGRMPSQGVMDGVLILFAGGMLAAPGFITDFLGLALLVPAVRAPIKALVRRRLERALAEGRIVMLG